MPTTPLAWLTFTATALLIAYAVRASYRDTRKPPQGFEVRPVDDTPMTEE